MPGGGRTKEVAEKSKQGFLRQVVSKVRVVSQGSRGSCGYAGSHERQQPGAVRGRQPSSTPGPARCPGCETPSVRAPGVAVGW